jgi:hypothetical protein
VRFATSPGLSSGPRPYEVQRDRQRAWWSCRIGAMCFPGSRRHIPHQKLGELRSAYMSPVWRITRYGAKSNVDGLWEEGYCTANKGHLLRNAFVRANSSVVPRTNTVVQIRRTKSTSIARPFGTSYEVHHLPEPSTYACMRAWERLRRDSVPRYPLGRPR